MGVLLFCHPMGTSGELDKTNFGHQKRSGYHNSYVVGLNYALVLFWAFVESFGGLFGFGYHYFLLCCPLFRLFHLGLVRLPCFLCWWRLQLPEVRFDERLY